MPSLVWNGGDRSLWSTRAVDKGHACGICVAAILSGRNVEELCMVSVVQVGRIPSQSAHEASSAFHVISEKAVHCPPVSWSASLSGCCLHNILIKATYPAIRKSILQCTPYGGR